MENSTDFYVCRKKYPSIKTLKHLTQDVQEAKTRQIAFRINVDFYSASQI
jgi:hypothetical protein